MEIGFIGMGNMGYAMLKGVLQYFPESEIIFSDTNKERCEKISAETGVEHADSNAECANKAKYVIFAVKPQYYKPMLESVENVISRFLSFLLLKELVY